MNKLKSILILFIISAILNSCSEDQEFTKNLNFVSFEHTPVTLGVDIGGTTTHTFSVYTTNIISTDRTYQISVDTDATTADAAAYSIPESVTIPANSNEGTIEITLNDNNIGNGKTIVLKFATEEDGLYTGGEAIIDVKQICKKNEVLLNIEFDGYASECSWELLSSDDEVIASGGGYEDGDENFMTSFCLDNGSYTFVIYDVYEDGLSYPENGSAVISFDGTELVRIEGDFGASASETFQLN